MPFRRVVVFLWLLLAGCVFNSLTAAEPGAVEVVRYQNSSFPAGGLPLDFTNVVSVARNNAWTGIVALRDDGRLTTAYYPENPPAFTNVAAIAPGHAQGIVLLSNGTVRTWGSQLSGVPFNPKLKKIQAVAAGASFGLALRKDGRILGWGDNSQHQLDIPRRNVRRAVAIACGSEHALALKRDGTVVAWGNNSFGQTTVPIGLQGVKAIAAGGHCSMALLTNGTVVAWGNHQYGQTNVPPGLTNVIEIAVGLHHCLALKNDGTVVGWGFSDAIGTPFAPPDLAHVTRVFAMLNESVFITKGLVMQTVNTPSSAYVRETAIFRVNSLSSSPVRYQWRRDGMDIPGATNAAYGIESATLADSATYSVFAENDFSSRLVTLPPFTVKPPAIFVYPTDIVAKYGGSVNFSAWVEGVEFASIRWYFNGTLIPGSPTSSLPIDVTPKTGGLYHAVARIGISRYLTSNPALLTVLPGWSVQPATLLEGDGTNVQYIPLTAHASFPTNVTLQYWLGGSSHAPRASGQITLLAGSTNSFIPVTLIGDTFRQANETFSVTLNGSDVNVALWEAIVTVQNDDAFPLITATPELVLEGDHTNTAAAATLRLSAPATNTITVRFETQDGTAIAGQDYLATNGFITIPPGQTTASVPITIVGNVLFNSSKTFELTLSDATNAFFTNTVFTIRIGNDDWLNVPAGFSASLVATGLKTLTAFAVLEDRILACEQIGRVVELKDGQRRTILELNVNEGDQGTGEIGLLGLATHPSFASNGSFYLYYTRSTSLVFNSNRVSRFTYTTNGPIADTEQVLLDLGAGRLHNAGGLKFGPDGKLYISAGENGNPTNAQTLTTLEGKILRLNADGTIPSDNPFYFTASGNNRAIWAYGLRNPWRFDFEPMTGRMFINDVGQDTWEEINEGAPGANYGWPLAEGFSNEPGLMNPFFVYGHIEDSPIGCSGSITGGAFVGSGNSAFPAEFSSSYFFADYCRGFIRRLDYTTSTAHEFATWLNYPSDLQLGPDGALYCAVRHHRYGGGAILRFTKATP